METQAYLNQFLYTSSAVPTKFSTVDQSELEEICAKRVRAYQKLTLQISKVEKYQNQDEHRKITALDQYEKSKDDDQVAFHFLQIVFAQNEDHIRKFAQNERWILETRLACFKDIERSVKTIFERLGKPVQEVNEQEWREYGQQMINAAYLQDEDKKTVNYRDFYKTDFKSVLKPLSNLRVFLRGGIAFIHYKQLFRSSLDNFQDLLVEKLMKLNQSAAYQNMVQVDLRLQNLLVKLPQTDMSHDDEYMQFAEQKGKFKLSVQMIDSVARQSFPLCMKYLYDKLLEVNKLKHYGRLQLGLFLKGAGLPLEEALFFWKSIPFLQCHIIQLNFVRKCLPLTLISSMPIIFSIIMEPLARKQTILLKAAQQLFQQTLPSFYQFFKNNPPGPNEEYHGCPFRHFNDANLSQYLAIQGITYNNIQIIVDYKRQNHFQIACKKTWEALHQDQSKYPREELIVDHPLRYYKASRNYYDPQPLTAKEKLSPNNK